MNTELLHPIDVVSYVGFGNFVMKDAFAKVKVPIAHV